MMGAAGLLARSSWRFYRRHPAQLLLSVLGIVLGVGIVTAVLITNASATRAFALSSEALYGRTTHYVTGADGLDQSFYARLRIAHPGVAMAPVVEGNVAIADTVISLIGLDPFAEADFGRFGDDRAGGVLGDAVTGTPAGPDVSTGPGAPDTTDGAALALLTGGDAFVLAASTLARLELPLDVPVRADTPSGERRLTPVATFESDNPAASEGLAIADIALVQELLARGTRIDRIELVLGDDEIAGFEASLPPTLRLVEAASRMRTMQSMTRGFQINLTAMSLLALVVGAFLIHNTMTFAVLQRRELFAILRITGVTSRQVLANVLGEAVAISLVGSIAGVALGRVLAEALIRLTTRTINDLYFVLHVQEVFFGPWLIVLGLALGIGSSLLAASLAAIDAARTSPVEARQRSLTEERTRGVLPALALAGVAVAALGALLGALPLDSLTVGFAALMLLILGYGLALPWAIHRAARALQRPAARLGVVAALAVGGIERNISRTGLAIAALTIAVSATFGVDIMITSFRSTVDDWLGTTLKSDVYVSSPSTVSGASQAMLEPEVKRIAASTEGVAAVSTGRTVDLSTGVGTIEALVLAPHATSDEGFEFLDGDGDLLAPDASTPGARGPAWRAFLGDDAILISEPLATKHALATGDTLELFTGRAGRRDFPIAGVFRDYASSNGKLMLARTTWDRWWDDAAIGSLGLMIDPAADAPAVVARLRARLDGVGQPLSVQSNTAIHDASLAVFDRTFEVTKVLRWLTVGVAFVGIFSALLALHLERAREFAVLRATGATRSQVLGVVMTQTLLMGLAAGIAALPLGWMLSEVLIEVINVRSFGWRMEGMLPPGSVLATVLLAVVSAALAGLWPGARLSRAGVAGQLRDE